MVHEPFKRTNPTSRGIDQKQHTPSLHGSKGILGSGKKVIMAYLYDERTGALSQRPCIISAKFDSGENFQDTDNKLNLHESKEETYLTSLSLAEKEPPVGEYLVQIGVILRIHGK